MPDIEAEVSPVESINDTSKLKRIYLYEYKKIEGDTNPSPDYDEYTHSLTSMAEVNEETKLRLVERIDSIMLFRQNPEKCHLISQSEFKDDKNNPNNILFMSRYLHQHFDAIDSTEGIPSFYFEYVSHSEIPIQGIVNKKPCMVYETQVKIEFKDNEAKSVLAQYITNYSDHNDTSIIIILYFPSPLEFKKFAKSNADIAIAKWKSYDGVR